MIKEIEISRLKVHPQNVRKDYNDIDELAESIKAQGILQNLTVVEDKAEPGTYLVVIGNRRLTAAAKAGIQTVPCSIVEMEEKEQISTMLLENMQRNDLTIYEQAQGFQMMLDFGETENTIAEKTGFSRTTIRHRLNIAKLNQRELKKKEQDDGFQMTLKDLYELEKVPDIRIRNRILKEAKDSRDLAWKAQSAALEIKREKNAGTIIKILEGMGVEPAPEKAGQEIYTGKWETVKEIETDKDIPERIPLRRGKEPLYYIRSYRTVKVLKKAKKVKKPLTEEEIRRKQLAKNRKEINEKYKELLAEQKDFIQSVIAGKTEPLKDTAELETLLWKAMLQSKISVSENNLALFFTDKDNYWDVPKEELEEAKKNLENMSILHQMLILVQTAGRRMEPAGYNAKYSKECGRFMDTVYQVLKRYGFSYASDEAEKILDGTHELYAKDVQEAEEEQTKEPEENKPE